MRYGINDLTGNSNRNRSSTGIELWNGRRTYGSWSKVCIMDINPKAEETAKQFVEKGYECEAVITDLGNDETREAAFSQAVEKLGGHLDILVNGAGVQRRYPSEEFPLKEWDFVINVNLRSVFALCQLAGKTFMKQDSKGKIINIASMLSSLVDIQFLHMRHPKAVWLRLPKHFAMNGLKKELT